MILFAFDTKLSGYNTSGRRIKSTNNSLKISKSASNGLNFDHIGQIHIFSTLLYI